MNLKFNQEFVYPEHTIRPIWVEQRLSKFFTTLKQDTDRNLSSKMLQDAIVDNLEENILHSKIKIKKVLDIKGIEVLIHKLDEVTENGTEFMWYYYLLMQAGFTLSSVIPSSFQPEALVLPKQFVKEKNELVKVYQDSKKTTEDALKFQKAVTKIAEKVKVYFEENNIDVVDLMNSGAKGNVSHIQSLLLSVGLSINSFGEINDVIDNSHSEGMTQTQFFNGSSQAIQALYAKSSETSKPGYLGRKLGAITERIKLSKMLDCGTKNYFELKIRDKDMLKSFEGRYYKSKAGLELQIDKNSDIVGDVIKLRSPLFCKAKDGICQRCYNKQYIDRLHLKTGDNIGLMASTGLTGSLVNLTLKKSHVGVGLDKANVDFREEIKSLY
jgi:DNA-directed RNA polymerase subunit beta'